MRINRPLFLFASLIVSIYAFGQQKLELSSPDGNVVFYFNLTEKAPQYKVDYKKETLINYSELSLSFVENGILGSGLKMLKPLFREVDETYDLVVGKTKTVRDHYKEVRIPFIEENGKNRRFDLVVRVFNDGVAFRYEFPEQEDWHAYQMTDENSTFNMVGDPTVYTLFWGYYNNNHEGQYHILPLSKVTVDTLMDLPALFKFRNKTYMAITEAALRNYAGMYLSKDRNGILRSKLSPLPGQAKVKVKAQLPHHSPWRVMMIGDHIGTLIESNIITNLNEPSKIRDISWIKPGKTSFHWWNGDITPDTTFAPGVNFQFIKYYIDFCARNHIEYNAVIGYGGFAWYVNDWVSYGQPGNYADVTEPVPSLNMQQVCDYARKKGVGIHVWVHWKALYPQMEEAFTQFEKWGIKGMMVDFLDRDDQEMVNIEEEILECAARHRLYIQFHGAHKPTGLYRTYPNEFTREGTYNYEQNKWRSHPVSPEHDLNIVFTRMLAGPTDYHLGGFRAVPASNFRPQYTRPLMGGTRCHMLGMYVVLESYLSMVCDYPAAYEGQPGFDFIKKVPTIWDETVVPDAKVGKYVVIARRKDKDWYVGSLNNSDPRTVSIKFDFLSKGKAYKAILYSDGPDTDEHPNKLSITTLGIKKGDVLSFKLASGGGMAMHIIPNP